MPDRVVRPFINRFGFQDLEVSKFLVDCIQNSNAKNKLLIDIGANQGLQTLQIMNSLSGGSSLDIICIEPHNEYFQMLKKNLEHIPNNVTLLNMALVINNENKLIWFGKRNATATLDKELSFDKLIKLKSQCVNSLNIDSLISKYIESNEFDGIFVKSDTDGSDIKIFNTLIESSEKLRIESYALEIIFTNVTSDEKVLFLKNIEKFSTWILQTKKQNMIFDKSEIKSYMINYGENDSLNLFLR